MSAAEDTELEDIDSVCPHGRDEEPRPPLEYISDAERWEDDYAVLCNPKAIDSEWIKADASLFVEVFHR